MSDGAEPGDGADPGDGTDLADLDDVSNVLLRTPSLGPHGGEACLDLLALSPPEQTSVLAVTYAETPVEFVDRWNERIGTDPVRGGIVAVGETDDAVDSTVWSVRTIENPGDLTGVGIELSELLSELSTSADGTPVAICFNTLTSLLQYADLQRTFRFLHVVTGRVKTVGGVAHYHIDPEAHDQQTLATLTGLFDAVVGVDEAGDRTVKR
jgi:hypothetical protein